ncbi:MAG TPA: hypothetical protein VE954_02310 [Oligoflexus sp.]|uniref:hypothetical protein n=1 Tax=Oligoflexus sp. TaxID=1971216 RepID=UPI002D749ED1|nr:hypothetical protein [Oligoflexus sp.]HYX31920.1 hypothetical protein [Oligoflexus sp.]
MKILIKISLILSIGLLGLGALAFFQAAPASPVVPKHEIRQTTSLSTPAPELAAPLLDRDFTSTCLAGKDGFYRETLRFEANATTTFVRHFHADAQCQQPSQRETIQAGRYTLAAEEAGQLLLIVRNLHDEATAAVIPYFEALIKVDSDRLVMQSSPSTSFQYTATAPMHAI